MKWFCGENLGATGSFLNLIETASLDYDFYAFSDQDDVWLEDKMISAITKLNSYPSNKPSLYYSSQRLVDQNLNVICDHIINIRRNKFSCFVFGNIAGCTTVFNKTLLIEAKKFIDNRIWIHDGWMYKLCFALGGNIYADKNPHILYRQHENNVVGLTNSFFNQCKRFKNNIYVASVNREILLINEGYSNSLCKEYVDFSNFLLNYDKNLISFIKVLFCKNIQFYNLGLNLNYRFKVILHKL